MYVVRLFNLLRYLFVLFPTLHLIFQQSLSDISDSYLIDVNSAKQASQEIHHSSNNPAITTQDKGTTFQAQFHKKGCITELQMTEQKSMLTSSFSQSWIAAMKNVLAEWSQGGEGARLVLPWRTLQPPPFPTPGYICGLWVLMGQYNSQSKRANTDCAQFVCHLYSFLFCHL